MSKTAGVFIDSWKLATFKRHLDNAGYTYVEKQGPTHDTLNLQVKYEWIHELKPVIEAAYAECAKAGKP